MLKAVLSTVGLAHSLTSALNPQGRGHSHSASVSLQAEECDHCTNGSTESRLLPLLRSEAKPLSELSHAGPPGGSRGAPLGPPPSCALQLGVCHHRQKQEQRGQLWAPQQTQGPVHVACQGPRPRQPPRQALFLTPTTWPSPSGGSDETLRHSFSPRTMRTQPRGPVKGLSSRGCAPSLITEISDVSRHRPHCSWPVKKPRPSPHRSRFRELQG